MKKNDWLLMVSAIIYGYLFYEETPGLNYLLFSIILVLFLWIFDKPESISKTFMLFSAISVVTGAFVACYGNGLSVFSNIVSLALLSSSRVNASNSICLSLIFSVYSGITSVIFIITDGIKRKGEKLNNDRFSRLIVTLVLPVIVFSLFLAIYSASNILFHNLIARVDISFLSFGYIFFTFSGFLLIYAFFYHRQLTWLAGWENSIPSSLYPFPLVSEKNKDLLPVIRIENRSGLVMLTLLNFLLLIVNMLDVKFLFIGGKLPPGITYAEYIHQGVGLIILSIILAVSIILYYFRGSLNFYSGNKVLKILAYAWIVQNAFMVFTAGYKNGLYIEAYALTYKRIGVYVYLFLAFIGLITTLLKIAAKKNNYFLVRSNGWAFYFVLIFSCFINWDVLMTEYNLKNSKQIDYKYLYSLSEYSLPGLYHAGFIMQGDTFPFSDELKEKILLKSYYFIQITDAASFQSFVFGKQHVKEALAEKMKRTKKISLPSIVSDIPGLINYFPGLEVLELRNLNLKNPEFLLRLKNLKILRIHKIKEEDYELLKRHMPSLTIHAAIIDS